SKSTNGGTRLKHPPKKASEIVQQETSIFESKIEELKTVLGKARNKRLLICIKGYPDPDNIGSSLALQWIAAQFDIQAQIIYFDDISHHENRALVKKLDLDIYQYSEGMDLAAYDFFAITDAQNCELPIKLPETTELLCFVDHHKTLGTVKGHFIDIREDAGS